MFMTALSYWVLIVSFAKGDTGGLYLAQLDCKTQTITLVKHITDGVKRPIFARFSFDGKQLYVVDNDGDNPKTRFGALAVFAFDQAIGKLTLQGRTSTMGRGSCYVGLTPSRFTKAGNADAATRLALIANYGQGNVAAILCGSAGILGDAVTFNHTGSSADPKRQKGPHPHSFVPSPDGRFALSADLGTDAISVYPISGENKISDAIYKIKLPAGAGPRHIAFSSDGRLFFVTNELDNHLVSFKWDADKGTATQVDRQSALPADFTDKSYAADIHFNPRMPVIYTSNRGMDSIAVFTCTRDGKLNLKTTVPCGGGHPRGFDVTKQGDYLLCANRDADNVVVFSLDPQTGLPVNTGNHLTVPMPMCVTTLPKW